VSTPKSKHEALKGLIILLALVGIPVALGSVLYHFEVLSGLMIVLARISLAIAGISLLVALFTRKALLWCLVTFVLGVVLVLLSHVSMSPQQKADWNAEEAKANQAQEAKRAAERANAALVQAQQTPAESKPSADDPKNVNGAAVFAGLLTQTFRKNGSDVTVIDLDRHTILFDCTRELNPRESCYVLYKTYPKNRDEGKILKMMGISSLKFKTKDGLFDGATWEKDIP
jgi:hypothetical protein